MYYSPKQENKYVTPIVCTLIGVGILVYLLPNVVLVRAVFCQVLAVICLVAAVFLLVRYKTTSFIYSIRPRSLMQDDIEVDVALAGGQFSVLGLSPRHLDFVVAKKQGSRDANMECVLGLDSLTAVWEISSGGDYKKVGDAMARAREKYGTVDLYDYTITMGLEESILLLFRDGQKHAAIRIEPSEELRYYLVDTAKRNRE